MKMWSSKPRARRPLCLALTALTLAGCGDLLDDGLAEARHLEVIGQPILTIDSTSTPASTGEDSDSTGTTWDMGASAGSYTDTGTGGDTEDSLGCGGTGCATTGCGDLGCGTTCDDAGCGGTAGDDTGGGESGSGSGEDSGAESSDESSGDTGGTCPSEHEYNAHVEGDHGGGVGPTLPGWKGTKVVDTGTQCNFQNWSDSDGVDPAVAGCHQAYEDDTCGTPTNDRFGEWCDDADTLVETNPDKDKCHSHKLGPGGVGQGKPDVFSCSAYCNGIFGGTTTGKCQVAVGFCDNGVDSAYCACYSPVPHPGGPEPLPWPWPAP